MFKNKSALILSFSLAILTSSVSAATWNWNAGSDKRKIMHEDVTVLKDQTYEGDVSTDKSVLIEGKLIGDISAVGGEPVTVSGEATGDIVSLGGNVYIPGAVKGDVSCVGCRVEVSGTVSGNILAVGGHIRLIGQSVVEGDISSLGGSVEKGPTAVHNGSISRISAYSINHAIQAVVGATKNSFREKGRRFNLRRWYEDNSEYFDTVSFCPSAFIIMLFVSGTGLVLVFLSALFFPVNIENIAGVVSSDIWKSGLSGMLTLICFLPAVLLMTVSILGIPLVPFVALLFAVAAIFGFTAFCLMLGRRFFKGINKKSQVWIPAAAAAGYLIIAALALIGKLLPFAGGLLCLIAGLLSVFGFMLGLGGCWLTRLGARAGKAD